MNKRNVTRRELTAVVSEKTGITQKNSSKIVDTFFSTLKKILISGESIKLVHFGSFVVHDKSPRRGRNPQTGESLVIAKRHMVTFRPSRQLRESLNV
nr:integration host factor subunit alpha [uncultured Desulfobulbus sp.]